MEKREKGQAFDLGKEKGQKGKEGKRVEGKRVRSLIYDSLMVRLFLRSRNNTKRRTQST